jgi:hypothetical protein
MAPSLSLLCALLALLHKLSSAQHPAVQSIDDFHYDENNRLKNHQLLFHGNPQCESIFDGVNFAKRDIRKLGGQLLSDFYTTSNGNNSVSNCFVVCLERGIHHDYVIHPLLDQVMSINDSTFSYQSVMNWVQGHCQKKELGFLSYLNHDSKVYWVDENTGRRVEVGILQPGERNTLWLGSYLGHKFEVVHDDTKQVVGEVEVEFHTMYSLGEQFSRVQNRDVRRLVEATFESEWERAHRVKRTFSEFGFDKGKLPKDLFASMSAYYYNNREQATIEEWDNKGVFVNWWEKDVYFLPMPQVLKVRMILLFRINSDHI